MTIKMIDNEYSSTSSRDEVFRWGSFFVDTAAAAVASGCFFVWKIATPLLQLH